MDPRYRQLNTLNLQEVEQEIDLMISLVGEDPDDQGIAYITSLMKLAKALGTKRIW